MNRKFDCWSVQFAFKRSSNQILEESPDNIVVTKLFLSVKLSIGWIISILYLYRPIFLYLSGVRKTSPKMLTLPNQCYLAYTS